MSITLTNTIKFPKCEFSKEEEMPIDTCQFFYDRSNCHNVLRLKHGDCCVFCFYGERLCPSKQDQGKINEN